MQMVRRLLALGGAAVVALALAGAGPSASAPVGGLVVWTAPASYGGGVAFDLVSSLDAPAPAKLTLYVPAGYTVDTSVVPGTRIGSVSLVYSAKTVPIDIANGTVKTGDPASLPSDPAAQACAPGSHEAVWLATFKAAKHSTTIRFYVDPTTGSEASLGAYRLIACLPSPYVPVDQGGAPDGLRFQDIDVSLFQKGGSVFTVPASGTFTWRVFDTPYIAGSATPNNATTFEARTGVLIPHVLTLRARFLPKTKTVLVSGRLTAFGEPRRGVKVSVVGGSANAELLFYWGSVHTRLDGSYSFRKHARLGQRRRRLVVLTYVDPARGPCIDPSTAPGGCVDENLSPPTNGLLYLTLPKLRRR
jgi:hypothetical protein